MHRKHNFSFKSSNLSSIQSSCLFLLILLPFFYILLDLLTFSLLEKTEESLITLKCNFFSYLYVGNHSTYLYVGDRSPYLYVGDLFPYLYVGDNFPYLYVSDHSITELGQMSPYQLHQLLKSGGQVPCSLLIQIQILQRKKCH